MLSGFQEACCFKAWAFSSVVLIRWKGVVGDNSAQRRAFWSDPAQAVCRTAPTEPRLWPEPTRGLLAVVREFSVYNYIVRG